MTQSPPASGLLPALIAYYHRLEADPNQTVAEHGFSVEKIGAQVVLNPDGSFVGFEDLREQVQHGKKKSTVPKSLLVPNDGKGRSGQGFKPSFCWDNTGYALGRDKKGDPDRAAETFTAFRELHLPLRDELADDEGFTALCRFLEGWDPAKAESLENWEELADLNVVFKLRGRPRYVHQSEKVRTAWLRRLAEDDGPPMFGLSLISGERDKLARIHTKIRGVARANPTGAPLVSFNENAFESYGKSQSYNAPVGVRDAFRYTTALNRLLADVSRRVRIGIGDATVVFWSDREAGADAEAAFAAIFDDGFTAEEPAEHAATVNRVEAFLQAARQGRLVDEIADPSAPFYILGLSPNNARLNVRFWLVGTVRQFAERLATHVERLEMIGERPDGVYFWMPRSEYDVERLEMTGARPDAPPMSISQLLLETVRKDKGKGKNNDRREDIPPQLAGEVARSVLEGLPYPCALFDAVVRRVRIEASINHVKAAILKACLLAQEVTIMDSTLNRKHDEPAYHCGRMLALLAFAQEAGLKSVNAGVVRKNMGAAMATPGLVLGRLQRAAEVGHIPKLGGRLQQFVRDELQGICVALGDRIPVTLDLVKQGIFALGFYQEQGYLNEAKAALKTNRLHRTSQGEWMASALEVRVANALARAKVRYIYESRAVLKSGQERWPDFLIEGPSPSEHIYLEVLGFRSPEYDKRWMSKLAAYAETEITPEGGKQGRLVVLDWRDKWGENPQSKPIYPSDFEVYNLLRRFIPSPAMIEEQMTPDAEASNS